MRTLYHRVAACPWGLSFAASNRPWAEADKMVPYRRVVSETGIATLDGAEAECADIDSASPRAFGHLRTRRNGPINHRRWGRSHMWHMV